MKKSLGLAVVGLLMAGILAVVLTGCGESPAQAKADMQTALNNFKTSLAAFANPSTYTNQDSLNKALNDAKSSWNKVVSSAKNVKSVDTATLKSAWNEFASSIKNFDVGNINQSTQNIEKAVANLQSAWNSVYNSLK
jgi:hypothetical protein